MLDISSLSTFLQKGQPFIFVELSSVNDKKSGIYLQTLGEGTPSKVHVTRHFLASSWNRRNLQH